MADPYIGEIRMFAGNFAPIGWSFCDGQLLAISQYDALFALLGTTYGGDGQSTFALPDLRGRLPLHFGNGFTMGQAGGVESVTLTVPQLPAHAHAELATASTATTTSPKDAVPASPPDVNTLPFGNDAPIVPLHPNSLASTGANRPHSNMQPYLCVDFIIALFGIFPSQN